MPRTGWTWSGGRGAVRRSSSSEVSSWPQIGPDRSRGRVAHGGSVLCPGAGGWAASPAYLLLTVRAPQDQDLATRLGTLPTSAGAEQYARDSGSLSGAGRVRLEGRSRC